VVVAVAVGCVVLLELEKLKPNPVAGLVIDDAVAAVLLAAGAD